MGDKSKIEWTDATWNPVTGCTKVSQGCKNCYAETWANRSMGNFSGGRKFTDVKTHHDRLPIPLRWKKPRKIFVNSMSDLFHEKLSMEFIARVFAIMYLAKHHTFQILTKRPEAMYKVLTSELFFEMFVTPFLNEYHHRFIKPLKTSSEYYYSDVVKNQFPLKNVWLGVSVEDQKTADERIPILLNTPAAIRWISAEPLLGEITGAAMIPTQFINPTKKLDWVVVGGESGHKARPMHPDWVRNIRDDCKAAGVPFFFKQWGEYLSQDQNDKIFSCVRYGGLFYKEKSGIGYYEKFNFDSWNQIFINDDIKLAFAKVGKKKAGHLLDEVEYHELPQIKNS